MPPRQKPLQQSALVAQVPEPTGMQPIGVSSQTPPMQLPTQQSELARHAPATGTQPSRQRRTPLGSSKHCRPSQHCSAKSHMPSSGMQDAVSLHRLTPSPVGEQPAERSTQQLLEPPWAQISPASTQPGGFTQRRKPVVPSGGPHSSEQQSVLAVQISPKGLQPSRCSQTPTPLPASTHRAEQQLRTLVQASPDVEHDPVAWQRPMPGSGCAAKSQPPLQQSPFAVQICPSPRHVSWSEQRPPPAVAMQKPLQQLPFELQ